MTLVNGIVKYTFKLYFFNVLGFVGRFPWTRPESRLGLQPHLILALPGHEMGAC